LAFLAGSDLCTGKRPGRRQGREEKTREEGADLPGGFRIATAPGLLQNGLAAAVSGKE
jgi:hypothetical protein